MTTIYQCDGCGRELRKGQLRYNVNIDVKAAYDTMEVTLADLLRDHRDELKALIEKMEGDGTDAVEESVYKGFHLHLCPACQRAYIKGPLRFHPEQADESAPVDIDAFLKSLGLGDDNPNELDA